MTPKEKAKELIDKMYECQWRKDTVEFRNAKKCALIAVNEIIKLKLLWFQKDSKDLQYWQEVKQEIEKL